MVERLGYFVMVALLLKYIQADKEDGIFRCSNNGTYDKVVCSSSLGTFDACSLQDPNSIITQLMINDSDSRCSKGNGNYSFDVKQLRLTVYNGCLVIAEMCKNVSDTVTWSIESAQNVTTNIKDRKKYLQLTNAPKLTAYVDHSLSTHKPVAILIPFILFVCLVAVLVSACIIYRRKDRCAGCRNMQLFKNVKPSTGECIWLTESSPGPVYAVPLIKTGSAKTAYSEEVYCVAEDGTRTPFQDPTYDHTLVKGSYDICSVDGNYGNYGNYSNRKTLEYIAVVNQKPCRI
ncbi:hypothetical protein CHS0354_013530 [Potamilus streckersoni]|uniref:Uncharacterized protein n=1 Tax=Potamilus streckersoni TaxID=2493646 RepID=A0AAE0W8U7_9BIVA|nr:hypothetical protein CHS0354_013530 [Potamilus streckersoni]